jgi:fibronectin type 3 domain-containing protein
MNMKKLTILFSLMFASIAYAQEINLTWDDNSDNESSFIIERGTDNSSFAQIATVDTNINYYTDTNFTLGQTYYYRVKASNEFGDSSYTNTASIYAGIPEAPSNLRRGLPETMSRIWRGIFPKKLKGEFSSS